MVCLELLTLVVLWVGSCGGNEEKTDLYFSYMTTKTFAIGALPVVDLALEQINNRTDILPNYTLSYTNILDSTVSLFQFD